MAVLVIAATSMALGQAEAQAVKAQQAGSNRAAEQTIRQLHLDSVRAQLTNDIATLDRVWADDHTFTNPWGVVQTKADRLADIRSGNRKLVSFNIDDIQVRVYGDMAVVTSRATIKGQRQGQDIDLQARGIDVYVLKQGRWQLVAAQATRIAQPAP